MQVLCILNLTKQFYKLNLLIKDKKPMYEVDDIEGILYFKSKGNTINAYNLNN